VTCHGAEVRSTATHKIEGGQSASTDLEFQGRYLKGAMTWDTDNNLSKELTVQNLIPGGKATFQGRFNPESGNKNAALALQYQHPLLTFDANVNGGDDSSVMAGGSIVTGHAGLIGGFKTDYDSSGLQHNIALGYRTNDYGLLISYDNLSILKGDYYHRISPDIEVGAQSTILGGEDGTQLSIGGKWVFSGHGHSLRAKVNNKSILGLSLGLKIQEGFQAFASTDIDLKAFDGGNHKIGFGLEFGN